MTTQQYIQLVANSYFWVFIAGVVIELIYHGSEEYKKLKEIRKNLGTYPLELEFSTLIAWTLFIISIQLR
jgi:hypothetical protein